jgi:hypothetical protein
MFVLTSSVMEPWNVSLPKASVPVSELIGLEKGQVEILPRKSVEDTDKDFTGMLEGR